MELVQSLITVVVFIVLLGTLVLVHELGHFITARWAKVRVLEFGIGFPPRAKVLGRGKRPAYDAGRPPRPDPALPPNVEPGSDEAQAFVAAARAQDAEAGATLYTLNWLPIGGFVKLEGEDGDDGADPHSFANAKLWVKVGILLAGVTMNLLLAFALFTGIAMWGEPAVGVTVTEVVPGSPAAEAALEPGDTIATVDGRQYSAFDLQTSNPLIDIRSLAGQTVVLGIVHADGTAEDLTVTLREPATPDQGALGVSTREITQVGTVTYTPAEAISTGVTRTVDAFGLILGGLADLGQSIVTSPTTAPPASGPVGIAFDLGDILWNLGPLYVLYLAALLSANLALVNVLPFPPLDGGRILVILLKAIPVYGKRISLRAEQLTYAVGFVALFTFLIWITVFDVARQVGS
ncbi:MAG TPA: M50 family metallopeptidase [Candidatus Limnocylindrales bacterium]|nr:M50 family metallopeptidase [Candidatus Limnocylindrales bacterium]